MNHLSILKSIENAVSQFREAESIWPLSVSRMAHVISVDWPVIKFEKEKYDPMPPNGCWELRVYFRLNVSPLRYIYCDVGIYVKFPR